jgi:hypothetical protein
MRASTTIALASLATLLVASGAVQAQESPVCVAAPIVRTRDYIDPVSNELCMVGTSRVIRYASNPDSTASVQGRLTMGFDSTTFQPGLESSYFVGRMVRHLELSILEPTVLECEEADSFPGPRNVVIETLFYYDDAKMVQRDCATRATSAFTLPSRIRPYMESVIHWDSPCGDRPLTEVIEREEFASLDEVEDAIDMYVQGDCSK